MPISALKAKIPPLLAAKLGRDIPATRLRLREKAYMRGPSTVLCDAQAFKTDLYFTDGKTYCVQELDDEEPKKEASQVVLYLRQWSPSK